mmetsp:Transcript_26532/g.78060  ORF Transcript_26532/g.78060 Transcript_26532/m.78060 type:complete len:312 (-) Transcript_26532:225-1160(-)
MLMRSTAGGLSASLVAGREAKSPGKLVGGAGVRLPGGAVAELLAIAGAALWGPLGRPWTARPLECVLPLRWPPGGGGATRLARAMSSRFTSTLSVAVLSSRRRRRRVIPATCARRRKSATSFSYCSARATISCMPSEGTKQRCLVCTKASSMPLVRPSSPRRRSSPRISSSMLWRACAASRRTLTLRWSAWFSFVAAARSAFTLSTTSLVISSDSATAKGAGSPFLSRFSAASSSCLSCELSWRRFVDSASEPELAAAFVALPSPTAPRLASTAKSVSCSLLISPAWALRKARILASESSSTKATNGSGVS